MSVLGKPQKENVRVHRIRLVPTGMAVAGNVSRPQQRDTLTGFGDQMQEFIVDSHCSGLFVRRVGFVHIQTGKLDFGRTGVGFFEFFDSANCSIVEAPS